MICISISRAKLDDVLHHRYPDDSIHMKYSIYDLNFVLKTNLNIDYLKIRSIQVEQIYIFIHPNHSQSHCVNAVRISIIRKSNKKYREHGNVGFSI